jgi:hypothetical protein
MLKSPSSLILRMSLVEHLKRVRDFRTQPVYPLWMVLLLVIMGTMSGCTGYRSLSAFVCCHQAELLTLLQLPHKRLPSFSTLQRVMVRIDFRSLRPQPDPPGWQKQ